MLTTAVLVLMVASSAMTSQRLRLPRQTTKASLTQAEEQTILDEHNKYRRIPQATNMRVMIWDPALARHAQAYANNCNFVHNTDRAASNFTVVGENLYVSSASTLNVASAVKSWYDEVADYTFADNSCRAGKACGHYTQIVWATSYALGCGIRQCASIQNAGSITSGMNFVCNYGPAGNFRGRQPYAAGTACTACPTEASHCNQGLCDTTSQTPPQTSPQTPTQGPTQGPSQGPSTTPGTEDDGSGAGSIVKPFWAVVTSILALFSLHLRDC